MRVMRKLLGCFLALICSPISLHATPEKLDYLKYGSQIYSNVTVLRVTDTDVYFSYDKGFANVKLKYLDPEFQKKFDYDPDAAGLAERQQTRSEVLFQGVVASNIAAHVEKEVRSTNAPPENLLDSVSDKSLLGKPGPSLQTIIWTGEKPDPKGKYVLLYFWAPWSAACKKPIADMNALQRSFPESLAVIGLANEPSSDLEAGTDSKPEFRCGIDARGKLRASLGINTIPCVVLMDAKGIVRYEGHPAAITPAKLQALFR